MPEQAATTAGQEPANYDSMLANLIGNATGQEPRPQVRGDDGRFAGKAPDKQDEDAQEVDAKTPETDAAEKADDKAKGEAEAKTEDKAKAEAEDEDYLELPPEAEGKEPTRLKVSELLDGYQRAKTLESELTQARSAQARIPAEVETALTETMTSRQQYMRGLEVMARMLQVPTPDEALINPASDRYDPATYHAQMQQQKSATALQQQIIAEGQRAQQEHAEQSQQLMQARIARERSALVEKWPEFKDPKVVQQYLADAEREYGLKPDDFANVTAHRDYLILRDALAYRKSKATQETAVKAVKAKPKLVRSGARQVTNQKTATYDGAMGRLAKSNSLDDGAAAIKALL